MSDLFRLEETLPEAPGTSPFQVRGVYYARVLEHAKTLPGGVAQLFDGLVDPRVRDFMRQKFHFMDWYDALPMMPCGVTMARLCGEPFEAFMRERARVSMVRLIPSMFRVFSRLGGPRLAASHAPRLFKSYFDFVELRVSRVSDDAGTGSVAGVPLYLAPAVANQVLGIIDGALESLGASSIEASYRDVTVTSPVHGFSAVTFQGDFAWRLDQAARRHSA